MMQKAVDVFLILWPLNLKIHFLRSLLLSWSVETGNLPRERQKHNKQYGSGKRGNWTTRKINCQAL